MKILIVNVNGKNSSTGNIVYSEYKYLINKGHSALVCYGRGPLIEEDGICKFGIDAETIVHAGLARLTGYNGCFSPVSTYRLIEIIKRFKPDVIHVHEIHAYFLNIRPFFEYIYSAGIKVVMTLHCEYDYTGKCGHANECTGFVTGCGNCPDIRNYPKSLFFDHTAEMWAEKKRLFSKINPAVIVPSEWMQERVKKSFLSDMKVKIVHNGINTSIFNIRDSSRLIRQRHNIDSEKKILLGVAPKIMSEHKGGNWMLRLAKELKETVHLIMIGVSERFAAEDNVTLIGRISDGESLSEYYSAADLFLICSKKESFSLTCAEALACGTPVAGFRAGAPEGIFSEPYAVFTEYGNMESLTETVSDRLKEQISPEKIREYAVSNFSNESMCRGYEEVIRSFAVSGDC